MRKEWYIVQLSTADLFSRGLKHEQNVLVGEKDMAKKVLLSHFKMTKM